MNSLAQNSNEETIGGDSPTRVLIVDDDTTYVHLLTRYLKRDTTQQYLIHTSATAVQAIKKCEIQAYDLLLIDYNLPDFTGSQLLLELRNRLTKSTPPAIVLTASGNEGTAGQALRADAADYLPKQSANLETLSRSIHNALAKDRLRKSVESRTRELEQLNEALNCKNREIQQFYQTVSHEVKTPLAAAREFVAIVRDGLAGPISDEQVSILDYAITSCNQIATHFNDLVEITRLDAGKINLRKKICSVEDVVTRAVTSCASAIKAGDLELEQHVENPGYQLVADEDRITQVLSNLLGNAVKYTESGGKLILSVKENKSDNTVEFLVADSGCGIAPSELPNIFKRLYQASEVNHELMGAGLGLGLSIAKEIIALHDGKIWVESVLNEGSTFYFSLPIAEEYT